MIFSVAMSVLGTAAILTPEVARTLGMAEWRVFLSVALPLAKRGVLAGTFLAFARGLGEFGATMMIAGIAFLTLFLSRYLLKKPV